MNKETIALLNEMFSEFPVMVAEPADPREIDDLEKQLEFSLPGQYRAFLERYGGAIVGAYPVFGVKSAPAMSQGDDLAWDVTSRFRKAGWEGTANWLVISEDQAGNPIGLDRDGIVWICDHEAGGIQQLASTFEEYLRVWCLDGGSFL